METEKKKEDFRINPNVKEPPMENHEPPVETTNDDATNGEASSETVTTTREGPRRFTFEVINMIDLLIVIFCGISLIIATLNLADNIVNMIAGGFMGYIGGSGRGMLAKYLDEKNNVKITKKEVK